MVYFGAHSPVDYLIIGHLTCDQTPAGYQLGGTAAYAGLMAHALGLRVGIVTAWGGELDLNQLDGIQIVNTPTESSTIIENISTADGRQQYIHKVASNLHLGRVPEVWLSAPIVHLGPVVQEVDPALVRNFPDALLCLTPQGWLRTWDRDGLVFTTEWPEATFMLDRSDASVVSIDDLDGDENRIEELAIASRVLAVTEAEKGTRLYWSGDVRRFHSPEMALVNDTGAGDIFAAAFFTRLHTTRDPWTAARFATRLAAHSVTRTGLASIPTAEEIEACIVEVI